MTPILLTLACADFELSPSYGPADDNAGWDADSGSEYEPGDDTGDYGSETESDFLKLSPTATQAYVFVVNSSRNTVSRISVPELDVLTTEVGVDPKVATTSSDYAKAVVFNAGSDSLSVIDAETMESVEVQIRSNFNNMLLSPDGVWALVYNDADLPTEGSTGYLQSFNEISLVNTETGEHSAMAVGFHPRQARFTPDSGQLVLVAEQWMAVLDLRVTSLTPQLIELSEDELDPPAAEEVLIEPTGRFAFVRQYGETRLAVVDLDEGTLERVDIGLNPTDMDLSADGSQAIVVSRGSGELHLIDTQDPTGPQRIVTLPPGEILGSLLLSPDGTQGVLYTTAAPVARYTTWNLADDTLTVRRLEKPVASASVSPTGGTLLFFHDETNDPDAATTSPFHDKPAITMVDLDSHLQNALVLPTMPSAAANSHDGRFGFFIMDGVSSLAVLRYDHLLFDEIALRSEPVHVGVLPESTYAYVNQEHALGRLSFYDPDTESLQTITGFELNAGIEH